ncbi:MAG: DUF6338 family protein [Pseudomonadota bacterium]
MDWTSNEILTVLRFLLPGFVSAWIFHSLTSHPRRSEFERIVQALIFTTIVQALTFTSIYSISVVKNQPLYLSSVELANVVSLLIAVVFGLFAARFSNNDKLHSLLRKLNFTKETSYPSEWFGVFSQQKTYVVLHLTGERRLYGWPEEWPSDPNVGYFSMAESEWLTDSGSIPLEGVENVLIPAQEVTFVEFMTKISSINES